MASNHFAYLYIYILYNIYDFSVLLYLLLGWFAWIAYCSWDGVRPQRIEPGPPTPGSVFGIRN